MHERGGAPLEQTVLAALGERLLRAEQDGVRGDRREQREAAGVEGLLLGAGLRGGARGDGAARAVPPDTSVSAQNTNAGSAFETARITSEAEIAPILSAAIANTGANFIEMRVPTQDQIVPFVPRWVRAARAKNLPHFY